MVKSTENERRGPGRPKGSKGKIGIDIKRMILEAATELSTESLLKLGKSDPKSFWQIASRLVPVAKEISGVDGGPIVTQQALDAPPRPENYAEWIAARVGANVDEVALESGRKIPAPEDRELTQSHPTEAEAPESE